MEGHVLKLSGEALGDIFERGLFRLSHRVVEDRGVVVDLDQHGVQRLVLEVVDQTAHGARRVGLTVRSATDDARVRVGL